MELLTVVVIMAILAAIAAPSFRDMIARQRMRNASFDLVGDLLLARSEAIKRGATVTVTPGANWALGWTVDSTDGTHISEHASLRAGVESPAGATAVSFGRDGRSTGTTTIEFSTIASDVAARCVTVQPSGRASSSKGKC